MKEFLVDVPVKINIWIRPECQKRQFDVIREARPSILFIQSDGGRNDQEWEAIYQNRKLIDDGIDWNCQVFRLYEDHNNGLYAMSRKMAELVWNTVDRCYFLEDDQIPTVSSFRFCAELLEKYKDDQRIECICTMNHLGISDNVSSDYFFSRQGSIWGTATWKRVYTDRTNFNYGTDEYIMSLLRQRTRHNKTAWNNLTGYAYNQFYAGHAPGGEFWTEFNMYAQNRLQIIPKKNMMKNIGFTANAAHSRPIEEMPRGIRRVFDMETYECEFPIKHPQYVIPDIDYEKKRNRIMGYNHTFIKYFRGFEIMYIQLRKGKLVKWLQDRRHRKMSFRKENEK